MEKKMSIQTRKELLFHIHKRYNEANWHEKGKILDELIATTGYRRKYAIHLLNHKKKKISTYKKGGTSHKSKYNGDTKEALIKIWYTANQICSKRLVPFIPDLLTTLERFGHLALPVDVRNLLLTISPATVDRLLKTKRQEGQKGLSTTCAGSLLKNQIEVRTFADWNDVVPGFIEGDLVAHCGDTVSGSFLNTLVLTDIASTWTEFFPLLRKSEADVINALRVAQQVLPFSLLGLDTDNGSEFINYGLLNFCKTQKITFTRSRAYKKNDQAHVEEKNGSIIRKLIGYDRYEGLDAYNALSQFYGILRLYVNFFQPSLKLISKTRNGARVTKKYDKAKTPYQRLMHSSHVSKETKEKLKTQYEELDPVTLLQDLKKLQNNFWTYAWKTMPTFITKVNEETNYIAKLVTNNESQMNIRRYRRTKKPRKLLEPRSWRTKPDPFENVWQGICMQLELNPELTAKGLLESLVKENAEQFSMKYLRTMQRRVAEWRMQQIKVNQERNCKEILAQNNTISNYVSLIAHSIVNG
jgi:hypothetical protein